MTGCHCLFASRRRGSLELESRRARARRSPARWLFALLLAFATLAMAGAQSVEAQKAPGASPPSQNAPPPTQVRWKQLFDGRTLKDWQITKFGGQGDVFVDNGVIQLERGSSLTGITYLQTLPRHNYEVRVEAMRMDGNDFFSTVTFPAGEACCSLVVGGWGGALVGISSVDSMDASENETTTYHKFESKRWYQIRIRVRKHRIEAWIDDKQVVNLDTVKRKLSTRIEVSLNEPFGLSTWETAAGIRKIELRELSPEETKEEKKD